MPILVQPILQTRALLTKETDEGKGRISAVLCDLDGNPIPNDQQWRAVPVYIDSFSGERMAQLRSEQLGAVTPVYQAHGEVSGWFTDAPDFTINGVHGSDTAAA